MPKTIVITDSASDLDRMDCESRGIIMVPMAVTFGQQAYYDGVDLSREEFYKLLTSTKETPRTSQPAPAAFVEAYRQGLERAGHLVVICLSSGLSATYESALLAKEQMDAKDRITVIDSRSASMGQGLMAIEAAELAEAGEEPAAVAAHVMEMRHRLAAIFTLDTLEFLVRGGRLNKAEGLVGSLLKIKPILQLNDEGRIVPREKVRGRQQAVKRLLEIMGQEGRDLSGQRVSLSHARSAEEAQELARLMKERFGAREVVLGEISATIGTHVGPGCLAIFFRGEEHPDRG